MNTEITNKKAEKQAAVTSSFSLKNYGEIDFKDLQKVSFIYDKINDLISRTDSIHEDVIDFMLKPFIDILEHHGVNLSEQDF